MNRDLANLNLIRQSKLREKGIMGLGIFRDSEVERVRELVLLFGSSIWVLILTYIVKGIF